MKKLLSILLSTTLMFAMVGCAKLIKTETKAVEAIIADVDYDPLYLQPVYNAATKTTITITHPADYDILLKYEGIENWIDVSSSEYDKYKELVGTTIEANLITEYYDDETIKQYLELIEIDMNK